MQIKGFFEANQPRPINEVETNCLSLEFEDLVARFYQSLYQFAFSLTRSQADACDLTQHTFYIWGLKGKQLRDATKVKAWLFTTLHRAFLETRRRETRFPHVDLESAHSQLPRVSSVGANGLDSAEVLNALARVDATFRVPLALFYLEYHAYKDIAAILNVPLGTVKSRIARGIAQLQKLLETDDICLEQEAA